MAEDAKTDKEIMLLEAASKGNYAQIEDIIKQGVNVNAKDKYGKTALMHAASAGHLDVVKFLVEHGADVADVNAKDEMGWTASEYALKQGHKEIEEYLKKHKAQ